MSNKAGQRNTYVPPEGTRDAEVMLIGQNPGHEEVKKGKPFVGRSGKYLDAILLKNGIDRKKLYITSVVKQGTPHNRKPTEEEIQYWMPYLVREIKLIKPRTVVLMGTVAWKIPRFEGIRYIETYHPAAAMRFPRIREKFEKDIRELKKYSM
ncbi:MAG: uracil-DNA glycosylase [Dehalococcoidales bacterium]|nr:uracil-DNA glycosylase [Dehalococcoidales bacterium]